MQCQRSRNHIVNEGLRRNSLANANHLQMKLPKNRLVVDFPCVWMFVIKFVSDLRRQRRGALRSGGISQQQLQYRIGPSLNLFGTNFGGRWQHACKAFSFSTGFLQSEVLGEVSVLEGGSSGRSFSRSLPRSFSRSFRPFFAGTFRAKKNFSKNFSAKIPMTLHSKTGEISEKNFTTRFCRGTLANI